MATLAGLRARLDRLEAVLKPEQTVVMFRWGDHDAPVIAFEIQGEFVHRRPNETEEALIARALAPHAALSWVLAREHHQGSDLQRLRDPEHWKQVEVESGAGLENDCGIDDLLRDQSPRVREHMALVLEGVPPEQQREVYDRAIVTVLAAATRGESEVPVRELLERQASDVSEAAKGYGANLDREEEEERENLEDAIARVAQHNQRLRERIRGG